LDRLNPNMKNMQGNPYSAYDIAYGSSLLTPYGILKRAVKDTLKDQVFRKLDQLKELGKIPPEASIYTDVLLQIPGIPQGVTPDQLTDAMAEQALEMLKKQESEARASAPKDTENGEDTATPPAPAAGMPPTGGLTPSPAAAAGAPAPVAAPGQPPASPELDSALGDLSSLIGAGPKATSRSVVKISRERFVPSGETDIKHQKRKLVEQLSKDEEEETEFHKTQYEPNKETKPYLTQGNGNDNPEGAFANNPMAANVYFWQGA